MYEEFAESVKALADFLDILVFIHPSQDLQQLVTMLRGMDGNAFALAFFQKTIKEAESRLANNRQNPVSPRRY